MARTPLYIKLVKRARKFLRSGFMRRFPWLVKLMAPLFNRQYWVPSPHRMALGLSIGLFFAFSMMIVPLQMICAAFACLYFRGNLPIAFGACWITNPLTIPPLILATSWVGSKLDEVGFGISDSVDSIKIPATSIEVNWAHFLVGSITSGIVLAILAYPILLGILWIIPKPRKRDDKKASSK